MGGQQSNLLGNQLEVCCYARTDDAKSASEEFSPWTSKNSPAFSPNGPSSRSSPPVIVERRGSTTTKGIRHATNSGTRVGVSIPDGGAHPRKVETPRSTVSSNSTPSSYQDAARKMWEEDAKFEHYTTKTIEQARKYYKAPLQGPESKEDPREDWGKQMAKELTKDARLVKQCQKCFGLSRHDELVCGNCLEKFSTVKM